MRRDRYTSVMDPLTAHSRASSAVRKFLVVIWVVAVLIMLPLPVVVDVFPFGEFMYCYESWPSKVFERFYWCTLFALQLVLPTIYFVYAYLVIFLHLRSTGSLMTRFTGTTSKSAEGGSETIPMYNATEEQRRQQRQQRQQRGLVKLAVILVMAYLVCVSPQHLVFFASTWGSLGAQDGMAVYVFVGSNFLLIFNSVLNPVVYVTQSGEMKDVLRKMFCRCIIDLKLERSNQKTIEGPFG